MNEDKSVFDREAERLELEEFKKNPTDIQEEVYGEMISIIKQVLNSNKEKGMIILGKPSTGKTSCVKNNVLDNEYHTGQLTPLQFYAGTSHRPDFPHIFDDVNITTSVLNLNILKAILGEEGIVRYDTSKPLPSVDGKIIDREFTFSGKVFILLNEIPKNNKHFEAVKDRCWFYELIISRIQMLKLFYYRAITEETSVSKEDKLKIVDFLRDNTSPSTKNLNHRLYNKVVDAFLVSPSNWKRQITTQIDNDEYVSLILQDCSNEVWINETGLSIRQLQRYRRELGLPKRNKWLSNDIVSFDMSFDKSNSIVDNTLKKVSNDKTTRLEDRERIPKSVTTIPKLKKGKILIKKDLSVWFEGKDEGGVTSYNTNEELEMVVKGLLESHTDYKIEIIDERGKT